MLEDDNTKVLDVRTKEEIERNPSIVEDAINIDYQGKNFEEELLKLPKEDIYLVICSGGIRGRGACSIMEKSGFKNLYNLKGGLKSFDDCNT